MEKVTQSTIAEALEISRNTVARVFNNQPGVAEATRKAVLEKAKELGYSQPGSRNTTFKAASVFAGEVALIGHFNFLRNPFWIEIVRGLERHLSDLGISLRLVLADSDQIQSNTLPDSLLLSKVDGITVVGNMPASYYVSLQKLGLPLISYDIPQSMFYKQPQFDVVSLNNQQATYTITERLIEKGHRRLTYVGAGTQSASAVERRQGFELALKAHDIAPLYIPSIEQALPDASSFDFQQLSRELMALKERPTAYVCMNDEFAVRMLQFMQKFPELTGDAVITGFDNCASSADRLSEISATVDVHTNQIGRMMALQLYNRIQAPSLPFVTTRLSVTPLFRGGLK